MAVFIIPKPTAGNHALAANYAAQMGFLASSATGTLVVNQLAASVTPNSASKVYGAPDPVFSGVLTGFLPADGVTATYARTPGETVAASPYTISATLAPAAVLSNYAVSTTQHPSLSPKPRSRLPRATRRGPSALLTRRLRRPTPDL